jgi:ATP-dependent helicase HepA
LSDFQSGQRWISNTEAALGLGIVASVSGRQVTISFPAAAEERTYATKNAPLTRIIYQPGDQVTHFDGDIYTVADKHEGNGLVIYKCVAADGTERIMPEIELDCFVHFNTPKDRLLSGQIDPLKFFELRYQALNYLRAYQQSGVVGLLGPRVQLLPHQLYIAHQVANRIAPRVLLADEVGLGKTIEAGLIVHQQLQSGLATRVLILVPDSLLHQWLVEMLRRFNLNFSVLDEAICTELGHDEQNPFESTQLVLCPLSFLVNNSNRFEQALACEWDLLLIDEAHHLEWHINHASPAYQCAEALANKAKGVLLLTATPEQLGLDSHFARLRLLDPDRYYNFEEFVAEEEKYKPVNYLVQELAQADALQQLPAELEEYLSEKELENINKVFARGDTEQARERAINALLDRHGTGRVLFRNTRAAVQGFPDRLLHTYPLTFTENPAIAAPIKDWLQIEAILGTDWLALDSRVRWLEQFLKDHRNEKLLLICANAETAIQLEEHLRYKEGIRSSVFHEGMGLIARDRAAAYFADTEDSAQLLVCSEIGSEGRNFQFAHHIIMFDLPLNPDLLEQRIGRLDRIGQTSDVHIHVPFYEGTAQQVLLNWFHQGLNAFEQTCTVGQPIFQEFEASLLNCLQDGDEAEIKALVKATAKRAFELRSLMQQGRDQLLEMNSCRPAEAAKVIESVVASEHREDLEDFVEQFCDQLGVNIEMHSQHTVILHPSEQMHSGNLPGLDEDGITGTYSRTIALSREDIAFLSWEHPIVSGALDMILSGDHGNTAMATIQLKPLKAGTLLLEALFTVECIAPSSLRLNRYLPTTVIRTVVGIDGKDFSEIITHDKLNMMVERIPLQTAQALAKQARPQIDQLIQHAEKISQIRLPAIISEAQTQMLNEQRIEVARLEGLAQVNPNIRIDEIIAIKDMAEDMAHCLSEAKVRLNAVRLVMAV